MGLQLLAASAEPGVLRNSDPFPTSPDEAFGNPHIIFSRALDPTLNDRPGAQTHAGSKEKVEYVPGAIPASSLKEGSTELVDVK